MARTRAKRLMHHDAQLKAQHAALVSSSSFVFADAPDMKQAASLFPPDDLMTLLDALVDADFPRMWSNEPDVAAAEEARRERYGQLRADVLFALVSQGG